MPPPPNSNYDALMRIYKGEVPPTQGVAIATDAGTSEGVKKSWLKRERAKQDADVDTLDKGKKGHGKDTKYNFEYALKHRAEEGIHPIGAVRCQTENDLMLAYKDGDNDAINRIKQAMSDAYKGKAQEWQINATYNPRKKGEYSFYTEELKSDLEYSLKMQSSKTTSKARKFAETVFTECLIKELARRYGEQK